MNAFDDAHWIQNFRMEKASVAEICDKLRPLVCK
jgi:hypothetical protein